MFKPWMDDSNGPRLFALRRYVWVWCFSMRHGTILLEPYRLCSDRSVVNLVKMTKNRIVIWSYRLGGDRIDQSGFQPMQRMNVIVCFKNGMSSAAKVLQVLWRCTEPLRKAMEEPKQLWFSAKTSARDFLGFYGSQGLGQEMAGNASFG